MMAIAEVSKRHEANGAPPYLSQIGATSEHLVMVSAPQATKTVQNLSILNDPYLSLDRRETEVANTYFVRLGILKKFLFRDTKYHIPVIDSLILPRLDYPNSNCLESPEKILKQLELVEYAASSLVFRL